MLAVMIKKSGTKAVNRLFPSLPTQRVCLRGFCMCDEARPQLPSCSVLTELTDRHSFSLCDKTSRIPVGPRIAKNNQPGLRLRKALCSKLSSIVIRFALFVHKKCNLFIFLKTVFMSCDYFRLNVL